MPMGKGGPALVVTSTPATYTLFLRYADGTTTPQSVSKETWVQFERGETVRVRFNSIWGVEDISKDHQ